MPEKELVVAVVVACCRGLVSGLGLRISVLIGPTSSMAAWQTSNAAEEQAKPMQVGDIDYSTKSPPSKSGYLEATGRREAFRG
jgi:hypothetical protein